MVLNLFGQFMTSVGSLHDLVRVAAREYIPLERLRAARAIADEEPPDLTRREQALVHALRGDHASARAQQN